MSKRIEKLEAVLVAAEWLWKVLDDEGRDTPAMKELRKALDDAGTAPRKKPVQLTQCVNCRKLPRVEFQGNDAEYRYILTHDQEDCPTCPSHYWLESHQKTYEKCVESWNEFNKENKRCL